MQEKAKLFSLVSIVQRAINLPFLLILLLFYEKSFKSIILAQFLSLIAISLFTFFINHKYWLYRFSPQRRLITTLLKFGLPLVPASIFAWFLNSMDKIALRTWSDFYELGLYSAAFKLVMILNIINQAFSTFWAPTSIRWYENGVKNEKYVLVSQKLMTIFVLLYGLLVLFKDAVIMILDKQYYEASIIFPFLLLFPVMYTVSETTGCGIGFARKTTYQMLVTGIAAMVNLVGNFLLVPKLGGLGASISTGISFVVFFWLKTLISRKMWFKFDLLFYFVNIALLISLATVSVFFNIYILEIIIFAIILIFNRRHLMDLKYIAKDILGLIKIRKK